MIEMAIHEPKRGRASAAAIVRHFDEAAQDYAFKGAAHPDDWDEIEQRYLIAKERLIQHLMA